MFTRRDLLLKGLRSSSLLALAPTVPGFLAQTARAARPETDSRVLVVIQLDGGNDGINTLVPYTDEGYTKHRKQLRLPTDQLLKINNHVGLHPAMDEAADLLDDGRLAIVPGVGYPNPNRSHFESMATWQTARIDPEQRDGHGWLGRALDADPAATSGATAAFSVGSGPPPVTIRGRRSVAASLERLDDWRLNSTVAGARKLTETPPDTTTDLRAFVHRKVFDAYATADQIAELTNRRNQARSPSTGLARSLRTIADMLKSGITARVYYARQDGYDTHSGQLPRHGQLLGELSSALKAFLDDLANAGLADQVLVLGFSEFGRRVAENGSAGTDHGTAGPVFLAGPQVRSGVFGEVPSLTDLDDNGDLKWSVDFRRVCTTVLEHWLDLPSQPILGGKFPPLPLVQS